MGLLNKWLGRIKSQSKDFEIFFGGNQPAKNVLIFTEYINATYFISFDIPLRLMHVGGGINFATVSQKHVESCGAGCWKKWDEIFKPDIVVMTRYGHEYGVDILEYFKLRNVPVIYHIDDDLLNIPDSLGAEIRKRQGAESVVKTRMYLLKNCDLIYASTPYLVASLQSSFPSQQIFHGIYAPYMKKLITASTTNVRSGMVIGYMGSKGHQHDLALVVPALERLLSERDDLVFEVFGTIKMPEELQRFSSQVKSYSVQKSYAEFLSSLSGLEWDIGLAPLVDSDFNRCKAPTKFIEYTACDIPIIASDVPVYAEAIPQGGGRLVKDDWYNAISEVLEFSNKRKKALSLSQGYCENVFPPSVLVDQLSTIFSTKF